MDHRVVLHRHRRVQCCVQCRTPSAMPTTNTTSFLTFLFQKCALHAKVHVHNIRKHQLLASFCRCTTSHLGGALDVAAVFDTISLDECTQVCIHTLRHRGLCNHWPRFRDEEHSLAAWSVPGPWTCAEEFESVLRFNVSRAIVVSATSLKGPTTDVKSIGTLLSWCPTKPR